MSEEVTRKFLARLWALQAEAGLSNAELAERIGCDASYISHLRAWRRRRRLGLDIALGAASVFPELRAFFLPSDFPVSNTDVPTGNESPVEGQQ
jgi:hypothetical protein